jgi:TRAP-type uncharacterized transport system fused permease subunit
LYLNVAVVGYFRRNLSPLERIVIGICAVLLFFPSYLLSVIAMVISTPMLIRAFIQSRPAAAPEHA